MAANSPVSPSNPVSQLRTRGVFCNRTLNLRGIKAIGYDMDYTLIHYHIEVWEKRAYEYARERLAQGGWPIERLQFDSALVSRGCIIDKELGNIVKADRFGFVKAAAHGTRTLDFPELREKYARTLVDLRDARWEFLNTFFSISVGCLFSQGVDLLDARELPSVLGYQDVFRHVQRALDAAHIEGRLKAEIIRDPTTFVDLDPDLADTLLDQRDAGKKLLLITNSEWHYTDAMLRWVFERPGSPVARWRDLFDMVLVQARKPDFFLGTQPAFEIISDNGDLRPVAPGAKLLVDSGRCYYGGNASLIESALGLQGQDILYVGDHIFADVHVSKRTVRWRTALVLREIEDDVRALDAFRDHERRLRALMEQKTTLEREVAVLRLDLQRRRNQRSPISDQTIAAIENELETKKSALAELDHSIAPLAEEATRLTHPRWGPTMRAGIDKAHIARQIERYADIYFSRVSNFRWATPFAYFRPPKSSLPHDL